MKSKQKPVEKALVKQEPSSKEALTPAEFSYWLSIYRSKVYEMHYATLVHQVK